MFVNASPLSPRHFFHFDNPQTVSVSVPLASLHDVTDTAASLVRERHYVLVR